MLGRSKSQVYTRYKGQNSADDALEMSPYDLRIDMNRIPYIGKIRRSPCINRKGQFGAAPDRPNEYGPYNIQRHAAYSSVHFRVLDVECYTI